MAKREAEATRLLQRLRALCEEAEDALAWIPLNDLHWNRIGAAGLELARLGTELEQVAAGDDLPRPAGEE